MSEYKLSGWGKHTLEEGKIYEFSIHELHCWIKLQHQEIWIAHTLKSHKETEQIELDHNSKLPSDMEWARWALSQETDQILLQPVFPDKSLLVQSEYEFKINSGAHIQIFHRVPVWVAIHGAGKRQEPVVELPSSILSKCWFGSFTDGELCYYSPTKARRNLQEHHFKPHFINCPINIKNKDDVPLDFTKFCHRVERLHIYHHEQKNQLWADETNIVFNGEEALSDISITGRPPKFLNKVEIITRPRNPLHQSLTSRTFYKMLEIPGLR
jgi:hypothetical protein